MRLRPVFDDHGSAYVLDLEIGLIVKRVTCKYVSWEDHQPQLNQLWM